MFDRDQSFETSYLNVFLESLTEDRNLFLEVEKTLNFWEKREPLFAKLLDTPQSPPYHTEGPTISLHLKHMLQTLYAISSGQKHLLEIEEFAREKGYRDVFLDLEQMLVNERNFFECFVLCHDIAKSAVAWFDAAHGSVGAEEGFTENLHGHLLDLDIAERTHRITRYKELLSAYENDHITDSSEKISVGFYEKYGIKVHYYGHEKGIYLPMFLSFLERVAKHYQLSEADKELLIVLVAHHLDPLTDFLAVKPKAIKKYLDLATRHNRPVDDILRRFQLVNLLDGVFGSAKYAPHGVWFDVSHFINFLHSEHDFAPVWRAERKEKRKTEQEKIFRKIFQQVGLDGVSLLGLLQMDPSPTFGKILRKIQDSVIAGKKIPSIRNDIDLELKKRAEEFYKKRFSV